MEDLLCISPIDGRYHEITEILNKYFSEYALIKYRVLVEIKWLLTLDKIINIELSESEIQNMNQIINEFSISDAKRVKEIESVTKHDVKAVEYFLREKFEVLNLSKYENYIHFGCTSEDINNLAYGLMVKHGLYGVFIPNAEELISIVSEKAKEYRSIPMLSHTHGQPATPTTVGKEIAVYTERHLATQQWSKTAALIQQSSVTRRLFAMRFTRLKTEIQTTNEYWNVFVFS